MTKHTHQNRFAGHTGQHRSTIPKGGAMQDLPVLSGDGCWCGEEFGHDWPGKDVGQPHPREEGSNVNAEPSKRVTQTVTAKDLKGWNSKVIKMLRSLIQDHGIRYRTAGSGRGALLLYPPDGHSQPFRISTQRPPEETLKFLASFAKEFVPGWSEDEVTDADKERLAKALNSEERAPVPPTPRKAAQPRTAPPTPAVFSNQTKADDMEIPEQARPTGEWEQFVNERGEYSGYSVRTRTSDGQREWLCDTCAAEGKQRIIGSVGGLGGHARMHGPVSRDAQLDALRKMRGQAEDACLLLMEALGVELGTDTSALEAELVAVKAERDELRERLDSIKKNLGL